MSENEKYRDYANRIVLAVEAFRVRGNQVRVVRMKGVKDATKWLRLETAACKRFVTKMAKLIEGFE